MAAGAHQRAAPDSLIHRRCRYINLADGSLCGTTADIIANFVTFVSTDLQGTGTDGSVFEDDLAGSAVNGSRLGLRRRGVYFAEYSIDMAASATLLVGITKNLAVVITDPAMATSPEAEVISLANRVRPATDSGTLSVTGLIWVTDAEASAVGTPNGAVVRFVLSDAADGTPADAEIGTNTECYARVTYVGDLNS